VDVLSFCSLGRSVEAKLRQAGLRRGVDSPEDERGGRIMVFMHCEQAPETEVTGSLQVLQMATVVGEGVRRWLLLCCAEVEKSKSN
jgi:hypothetical protein